MLKENFHYREIFEQFEVAPIALFEKLCQEFGLNPSFYDPVHDPVTQEEVPPSELLTLLDPSKDLAKVQCRKLIDELAFLFHKQGIHQINCESEDMKPHHRVLVIDLRMRDSDLERQFKAFLDFETSRRESRLHHNLPYGGYQSWEKDSSRFRREAEEQLIVWNLRKQRKTFPEIASTLAITEELVRKRFYRAYELTQGMRFDREHFSRNLLKEVKPCDQCPARESCTELCPDALFFVKQDEKSRRETLPDKPILS